LGLSYLAQADLLANTDWAAGIAILEEGIRREPEEARLHERLSLALFKVGRIREAVATASRAASLRPFSARMRASLVATLAHAGVLDAARKEMAEAERLWPDSAELRGIRFSIELRYGDAHVAQRMIDRGEANLGGPVGSPGSPLMMRARLDPTPANVASLIRYAAFEAERAPNAVALRLQALGQFGAVEEAYRMLEQPGVIERLRFATEILFRPHLRDIRHDPRFPGVAARLGLLRLWHASGAWPDFCNDPRLPYDCREEAKRLGVGTAAVPGLGLAPGGANLRRESAERR
jgi:tetratricopeptide (TPR) repeat protein